jgi:hypothetical protein
VKSFKQFFENNLNGLTQSKVRRNARRDIFNSKVAKDHGLSDERKTTASEVVAKGLGTNGQVFLTHDKAYNIAKEYGINLPEEGEEKMINSNSQQKITKRGGQYYLTGNKVTT